MKVSATLLSTPSPPRAPGSAPTLTCASPTRAQATTGSRERGARGSPRPGPGPSAPAGARPAASRSFRPRQPRADGPARGEARKRCPHPAPAPAPGFVRPSRPRGRGVLGAALEAPSPEKPGLPLSRAGRAPRRARGSESPPSCQEGEPRLTGGTARRGSAVGAMAEGKAGARAALQCHQRNGFHMSCWAEKGGEGREFWAGRDGRMGVGGFSMDGAERRREGKRGTGEAKRFAFPHFPGVFKGSLGC